MDKIYCLVGPSGVGKTTIAQSLDYNVIQSYTTRPPREKGEWGHTFADMYIESEDVVAHNIYNHYHYWATKEQFEGKGKSIYVIDPPGVEMLKRKVDVPIVTIFLYAPASELYDRMLSERGESQAMARALYDEGVFATVKTDYAVNAALPLEKVIEFVKSIVRED